MTNASPDDLPIYRHRRACYGFGAVVDQADGRWDRPSPCPEWDARAVLEHVIGFHEVLLLRPLGVKANRPKDEVPSRWTATQLAIFTVLDANLGHRVDLPDGSTLDLGSLLPSLPMWFSTPNYARRHSLVHERTIPDCDYRDCSRLRSTHRQMQTCSLGSSPSSGVIRNGRDPDAELDLPRPQGGGMRSRFPATAPTGSRSAGSTAWGSGVTQAWHLGDS
jgi:hypothetical protein